MSKKSELKADLERIGYALSGGHLTRQARQATFSTFAKIMRELNLGIWSAKESLNYSPPRIECDERR